MRFDIREIGLGYFFVTLRILDVPAPVCGGDPSVKKVLIFNKGRINRQDKAIAQNPRLILRRLLFPDHAG